MELFLTCMAICLAKVLEISIQSVKTVCMVKGEKLLASALGFIECLIWGLVISSVIANLSSNFLMLLSYCIGYSTGLFLGSNIENKLALGTSSIQIMVDKENIETVENYLKDHNNGYTVLNGHGSKEEMFVIIIVLPRKSVKNTMKEINEMCTEKVFIVSSEVSKYTGGYGTAK